MNHGFENDGFEKEIFGRGGCPPEAEKAEQWLEGASD